MHIPSDLVDPGRIELPPEACKATVLTVITKGPIFGVLCGVRTHVNRNHNPAPNPSAKSAMLLRGNDSNIRGAMFRRPSIGSTPVVRRNKPLCHLSIKQTFSCAYTARLSWAHA